jgi:hypothetical protein
MFEALFITLCILLEIFLLVSTVDTYYTIYRYGDALKTEGTVCDQNVQVDDIGTVSSNNRYVQ